jgi:hypothetical protein
MIAWILSLLLTLLFSVGAAIPGTLSDRLARELQKALDLPAPATVQIEGDPLFQIPFGRIPRLTAIVHGYQAAGLPISDITLGIQNLQLASNGLFGSSPRLLVPAPATLDVRVSAADFQSYLDHLEAQGFFEAHTASITLFGRSLNVRLVHPIASLVPGRLVLSAQAQVPGLPISMPVQASFGIAIASATTLNLNDPRLEMNGNPVSGALFQGALQQLNPIFDLTQLHFPGRAWHLSKLNVASEGVTLEAAGELDRLEQTAQQ